MKALFIDFEDSFSYNVVQEMTDAGFTVDVLNWRDFFEVPKEFDLLVFGPGPGHPDEYRSLFGSLKFYLSLKRPFFGVCLGHQIFWRLQGEEVLRSKNPVHGQKVKLELNPEWQSWLGISEREVFVQRYNSLTVFAGTSDPQYRNLILDEEIMATRGEKILTYQFHPESVGTTFRREFMKAIYSIVK